MAAVPKRRHSTRRQGKRRASIKFNLPNLMPCPKCKALKLPHTACSKCGEYRP